MTRTATDPQTLPDSSSTPIADQIADALDGHERRPLRPHRQHPPSVTRQLVDVLRDRLPYGAADVHVLVDRAGEADGKLSIPAERAVELRNRKERQLVLMVPVGSGSAASSLDNSFARIDVTRLLAAAAELLARVHRGRGSAGRRPPGRSRAGPIRPVEAWARYVAAVAAEPSWSTAGLALWMVGLVPDEAVPNCSAAVPKRCLRACHLAAESCGRVRRRPAHRRQAGGGEARERIARFLPARHRPLRSAGVGGARRRDDLTFDLWPLVDRPPCRSAASGLTRSSRKTARCGPARG